MPESKLTYRDLIRAIPQKTNLANVLSLPASKLCNACQVIQPNRSRLDGIRNQIETDFERLDVFPEFPSLKASSKSGCDFCRLLRKTIRSTWTSNPILESGYIVLAEEEGVWQQLLDTEWDGRIRIHGLFFHFEPFGTFKHGELTEDWGTERQQGGLLTGLSVWIAPFVESPPEDENKDEDEYPEFGAIGKSLFFKVYDSVDMASPSSSSRRQVPDDPTLSQRNVGMIKEWFDICHSKHGEFCQLEKSGNPSRLLDLGSKETDLPKLIECDQHTATFKYAALSYVWGFGPDMPGPYRCVESVLGELKSGVEMDQLNGTFRDAIAVCRALGTRYLWIDALCIIQDSKDDWAKEASQMHIIFGNADYTIVAISAANAQCGFLQRKLAGIPAVKVEYDLDGHKESVIISPIENQTDGTREPDVEHSAWNQRGWPLIERALSCRLIYFCENRIYYECRMSLRSEENGTEPTENRESPFWTRTNDRNKVSGREYFHELWKSTLADLSGRKMLRPADRLVAMGNIATEMADAASDAYLPYAGIWAADLRKQLLWYVDEGPKARLSSSNAPSWSWAGIDAQIGFIRGTTDCEQLPKVFKEKKLQVMDIGPSSDLHQGRSFLEAAGLCRRLLSMKHIDENDEFLVEMRKEYPFDLEVGDDQESAKILAHGALDLDNIDNVTKTGRSFSYLHIDSENHPTGLILIQEDSEAGNVFQRVGVATIFGFEGELLLGSPFQASDHQRVVLV